MKAVSPDTAVRYLGRQREGLGQRRLHRMKGGVEAADLNEMGCHVEHGPGQFDSDRTIARGHDRRLEDLDEQPTRFAVGG